MKGNAYNGFTLIEISIVLVIIGLLVGGIMVGQDLIRAAEIRAQISQIEKYQAAVNAFRTKYNGLPGDILAGTASSLGFAVDASCSGQRGGRDGSGLVEGWAAPTYALVQYGEPGLFWEDLSTAGLIEGRFPGPGDPAVICGATGSQITKQSDLSGYFPVSKLNTSTYIYVFPNQNVNWFGVSPINMLDVNGTIHLFSTPLSISVLIALAIDTKVDDGKPTTGNVQAIYVNFESDPLVAAMAPNALSDSSTTCYNTAGAAYSTSINNGNGANCALSFRFQ